MARLNAKSRCDACSSVHLDAVHRVERSPLFENRLFESREAARQSRTASVQLVHCRDCDLVFNSEFESSLMDYDGTYQNAQEHSEVFGTHLEEMAAVICGRLSPSDHVVEIGCGKAAFLETVRERGWHITGYDPAYEGASPHVRKKYFDEREAAQTKIDAVVMRHTLEHIERPFAFLQTLGRIVSASSWIFIEIPRYEWIEERRAFWDVFHEHCNYFTEGWFEGAFGGRADIRRAFESQYMLVAARVGDLVSEIPPRPTIPHGDVFAEELENYRRLLHRHRRNVVWGCGAKGVAFVNVLDPDAVAIEAVIDINPRKQGLFVPASGHPCVAPGSIEFDSLGERDCLWIMNANYAVEILAGLPGLQCRVITLAAAIE